MNINEISHYLQVHGCILRGCSNNEILAIEKRFKIKLPATYVDFLKIMGKSAGPFMQGSSVFYEELFDINEGAIELLVDNGFKQLPDSSFVFFMHQGYQFAFFNLFEGENPPVYYYYEGRTHNDFESIENSYTSFLESQIAMSGL